MQDFNDKRNRLPKYLNEPSRYIGMTVDEAIVFAGISFAFLSLLDALISGLFCAGMVIWWLKRLKKEEGQNYLKQGVYWYLPNAYGLKQIQVSYKREYIG